ncbi:MAG: 4'-phosphopantetheinyl transferase family protein [Jatrophihabitantaceae bacterium]
MTVWLLRTDHPGALVDSLAGLLDPAERARAEAIDEPVTHTEFVVSHAASRLILGRLLGVPPGSLRWRHGPSGKPALAEPATDLQVSLSHSDGLAALAVTTGRPVGVDVQRRRSAAGLVRMAERYYPAEEASFVAQAGDPAELGRRFSTLWTRKEACAKVGGGRLIPALAWPSQPLPTAVGWDSANFAGPFLSGDPATEDRVVVRELTVPAGFHGAVALAGSADFQVVSHWWTPEQEQLPAAALPPLQHGRCEAPDGNP